MTTSSWSTLEPWDKAAQWIDAAPDVAGDVVLTAKAFADQRMRIENAEAQLRMRLEEEEARHRHEMEVREGKHLERMDLRLWYTQMASLAVNAISMATLFVIAVKFGRDATLPALAVAGANGGLTAAVLAVNLTVRRSWRRMRNEAASGEPLPPANDPGVGQ